jgi:hypothetical protein
MNRRRGECFRAHCNKNCDNYKKKKPRSFLGKHFCQEDCDILVPKCIEIIESYKIQCRYSEECNKKLAKLNPNNFYYHGFCDQHERQSNTDQLEREKVSVSELESRIPIYLAKLFDSLTSKKGIQFNFCAASGVNRIIDGADEIIELDTFLDIEEAHVACGLLLLYLLRFYKEQIFNIDGIGGSNSTGNIRVTAAVFLPGSFPKKSCLWPTMRLILMN